ncbi:MAG: hypothetical protein NVSMB52_18290 [Chloroflexota bacterium]
MNVPPWLLFLAVLTLTMSLGFQLISRRHGRRLLAYWFLTLVASISCEVFAETSGIEFGRMGDVRLLPDLLGALTVLIIAWFLRI